MKQALSCGVGNVTRVLACGEGRGCCGRCAACVDDSSCVVCLAVRVGMLGIIVSASSFEMPSFCRSLVPTSVVMVSCSDGLFCSDGLTVDASLADKTMGNFG